MNDLTLKSLDLIYRVPLPEALAHQEWLFANKHPIQYCDPQGVWQTRVLGAPGELRMLESRNGHVFIPLPAKKNNNDKIFSDQKMVERLGFIATQPPLTRQKILRETVDKLMRLRVRNESSDLRIEAIIQGTQDVFLVNKQTFENRDFTQSDLPTIQAIKKDTQSFVSRVTDHLRGEEGPRFLFDLLKVISTGSTLDHVNRVFNHTLGLMIFFNERMNLKSQAGLWRNSFSKVFEPYYRRLLPREEKISLSTVFPDLSQLSDMDITDFGIGALLHDIGKVPALDYFEGPQGYDRTKIMQHAFSGYGILTKTYEKNRAAALMAGAHHEYYGHPMGYGVLRSMYDPLAKARNIHPVHALTLDLNQAEMRQSLGFFPIKLLELTDIYDALTDPGREYRAEQIYSPYEAVEVMRNNFLDDELKIDPLCYDLFCHFLVAEGHAPEIKDLALVKT